MFSQWSPSSQSNLFLYYYTAVILLLAIFYSVVCCDTRMLYATSQTQCTSKQKNKLWTLRCWNFVCVCVRFSAQELKGRFLIKGKRLNKLDAFFTPNNVVENDSVSEEDEAADITKGNEGKRKSSAHKASLPKSNTIEQWSSLSALHYQQPIQDPRKIGEVS